MTGDAPAVIVFDVNETLSDMAPMAARFADLGADPGLAALWFAGVLRDGFALTAVGAARPFAEIAAGGLRAMLDPAVLDRPPDDAVAHVLEGFSGLPVHPDVPPGVAALAAAGYRLVTLSNGAATVAERLLAGAGLRDRFADCLSVDDAGAWKPAAAAYHHAASRSGVAPGDMLLVAVHPWDIDGAARAGLRTAWIDRAGRPYPSHLTAPVLRATGIDDLARRLGA